MYYSCWRLCCHRIDEAGNHLSLLTKWYCSCYKPWHNLFPQVYCSGLSFQKPYSPISQITTYLLSRKFMFTPVFKFWLQKKYYLKYLFAKSVLISVTSWNIPSILLKIVCFWFVSNQSKIKDRVPSFHVNY